MQVDEAAQKIKAIEAYARLRKVMIGAVMLLGIAMWAYAFYNFVIQGA